MSPEDRKTLLDELERLRAARVPLEAVRWTHGRRDGPVALVTGPGSHARADFSRGLKETARYVRVEHFLARLDDPSAVAAEIRRAKDAPEVLVIAVCRGGGDQLALAVFSHPDVVRAVAEAASIKPVVTGIGHTNDHCLADDYASIKAELPYAAGEVIHRARQSAWRRLQSERACAAWESDLQAPRAAHQSRATVKLIVAAVFGLLLAVAACPRDARGPATTSHDLAPSTHYSAAAQVLTKKKRSAPSPQQPPAASVRPPEDQPGPPAHDSALIPTSPPEVQPPAAPQRPEAVPQEPRGDQG